MAKPIKRTRGKRWTTDFRDVMENSDPSNCEGIMAGDLIGNDEDEAFRNGREAFKNGRGLTYINSRKITPSCKKAWIRGWHWQERRGRPTKA